jgi:hypothetical protein
LVTRTGSDSYFYRRLVLQTSIEKHLSPHILIRNGGDNGFCSREASRENQQTALIKKYMCFSRVTSRTIFLDLPLFAGPPIINSGKHERPDTFAKINPMG